MNCDKCGTNNMGTWSTVGRKNYCQSCMEELVLRNRQAEAAEAVARQVEEDARHRKQQTEDHIELENKKLNRKQKNLLLLIKNDDLAEIKQVLRDGALDVNSIDFVIPIYITYSNASTEYLKQLVNIDAPDSCDGDTAFIRAAISENVALVEQLLTLGANIDAQSMTGKTALMMASADGHEELVKKLIMLNADLKIRDQDGNSPLMWAADNGNLSICKILTEAGLEVDEHDSLGNSALNHCTVCLDIMVSATTRDGEIKWETDPAISRRIEPFIKVAEFLINSGADPKNVDFQGNTPQSILKKYNKTKFNLSKSDKKSKPSPTKKANKTEVQPPHPHPPPLPQEKENKWWEFWKN